MPFDLILRGGRVIDPSQKLDAVTDVAFAGGKVVMVGSELKADPEPMCATCRATSSPLA
jgi:dihydroorotase